MAASAESEANLSDFGFVEVDNVLATDVVLDKPPDMVTTVIKVLFFSWTTVKVLDGVGIVADVVFCEPNFAAQ